jgi:hypothetical protein
MDGPFLPACSIRSNSSPFAVQRKTDFYERMTGDDEFAALLHIRHESGLESGR